MDKFPANQNLNPQPERQRSTEIFYVLQVCAQRIKLDTSNKVMSLFLRDGLQGIKSTALTFFKELLCHANESLSSGYSVRKNLNEGNNRKISKRAQLQGIQGISSKEKKFKKFIIRGEVASVSCCTQIVDFLSHMSENSFDQLIKENPIKFVFEIIAF